MGIPQPRTETTSILMANTPIATPRRMTQLLQEDCLKDTSKQLRFTGLIKNEEVASAVTVSQLASGAQVPARKRHSLRKTGDSQI